MGRPWRSAKALVKALEVSSRAAGAVGPKQGMPARASRSARPRSSAASGPITTRSAAISAGQRDQAVDVVGLTGRSSPSAAMPGLPGASDQPRQQRRLGDLPGQRVLAPAGADQEDVHGRRVSGAAHAAAVNRRGGLAPAADSARYAPECPLRPTLPTRRSTPKATPRPTRVSELAFALKRTLEDAYGFVRLRGELSKVTRHSSGHVYLTLKDEQGLHRRRGLEEPACAACKAQPEQGLEVIVTGRITTYPSGVQVPDRHRDHGGARASAPCWPSSSG